MEITSTSFAQESLIYITPLPIPAGSRNYRCARMGGKSKFCAGVANSLQPVPARGYPPVEAGLCTTPPARAPKPRTQDLGHRARDPGPKTRGPGPRTHGPGPNMLTHQATNQPTNRPPDQLTNPEATNRPNDRPANQPTNQATNQPANAPGS